MGELLRGRLALGVRLEVAYAADGGQLGGRRASPILHGAQDLQYSCIGRLVRIMPRKLALSPLQNRVLWTLEEAGEESIATVKATLCADDETLDREIAALERFSFVQRATQASRPSLVLTSRGHDALTR